MGFPGTALVMRVTPGKPYCAKQVTEHTQTLADETHITQPVHTEVVCRDSAGRTRIERPMGPASLGEQYTIVEIRDPIAQAQYTFDPVNKVAHRVAMQVPPPADASGAGVTAAASGAVASVPPSASLSQSPTSSGGVSTARAVVSFAAGGARTGGMTSNGSNGRTQREDLGTQAMQGLIVQGTKFTTTVPVGAQGNDRPLITVRDQWVARDLGLTVLSHIVDPRNGETTVKMTEISTTEPDPSLFVPPPDYSVVDETGAFQIKFYAQPKQQQ